uniref:NAD(P)H oxidase (H2O2-forming) n=1 Tax=Romanomermis culicivorax TaxID=13658 RepID=A0A915J7Z2_ROMCU
MTTTFVGLFLIIVSLLNFNHGQKWEFQRYDGWYNNLAHPEWGSAGSRLYRHMPSAYSDGIYMLDENLPSARLVSDTVFKGQDGMSNERNITTMFAFFSQVVAYEIMQASDVSCPLEMHKIAVNKCDDVFDSQCEGGSMMPFLRAKYDKRTGEGLNSPREQVNERTSWIDASFLYSVQEPWVNAMRSFHSGLLREGVMPNYPPLNSERVPLINPPPPQVHRLVDPERLFLLGDSRVNENPALLSMGLMLYRWHNYQARRLKVQHPDWTDDDLFHRSRQMVIATLQNIIMYEFLPVLIDEPVAPYKGHNPHLPPGVSHLFAAAAFRYPHTWIPPGLFLRNGKCRYEDNVGGYPAIRLCNTWWNSQDNIQRYSMDQVILGMASQIAERDDHVMVHDLRDYLFGPMHFSRRDLAALSIMRGRDNGLMDYNSARKFFNLTIAKKWSDINPQLHKEDPKLFENLKTLYNDKIETLDVYVGGLLEANGHNMGALFKTIVKEQFYRTRDADRFWFENLNNGLFTEKEIKEIKKVKMYDLIIKTTNIEEEHVQKNVFYFQHGDPCPQPYQLNSSSLEPCIPFMRHDHFMGNEVAFIYTCIGLGTIPLICIGIGYWMVRRRKKLSAPGPKFFPSPLAQIPQEQLSKNMTLNNKNNNMQIYTLQKPKQAIWVGQAVEWMHEKYSRSVNVVLDHTPSIQLTKRRGGLLRHVGLENIQTLYISVSDSGFMLIVVPNDYDVVLHFETEGQCAKFLVHTEQLMKTHGRNIRVSHTGTDALLKAAETRETRQKKLEHFFRDAYAQAFQLPQMKSSEESAQFSHSTPAVLRTTLNRAEFAEALGMNENDLFIERMFLVVTRGHGNKMSFQDFLETVVKFSKGQLQEKLEIIYLLCLPDEEGRVDREEFCEFMRSIMTAGGTKLDGDHQEALMEEILFNSGIPKQKDYLTQKDFEAILSEVSKNMGLHLKGRRTMINSSRSKNCLGERESVSSFTIPFEMENSKLRKYYNNCVTWLEDNRQHVSCLLIFFLINGAVFFERFWHYYSMNEHRDLRRVMGLGIAITRGSAASISFCMGLILLTVCRNCITKLRETPLNDFVPFDAAISFHKLIGITIGFFSLVHTAGHCINFYHVSTQDHEGLRCLFQEAVFSSDFQPSIIYWFFGTVTGITGIFLVVVMSVMYVFAAPSIINSAYHAFRITHLLNILLYALAIAHGLPKLLDSPRFWYYILGPAVIFIFDRIIGLKQEYKKLDIIAAELLPSDVTYIKFKRPRNFSFKSGQWIRTRCPALGCNFNEWHAFSLASAPQEPFLEIYVKAQGPWTWKLKHEIAHVHHTIGQYPTIYMDGPYGGGNQEWRNYEIAIMVGGGIGVTPYASMLNDLIQATSGSKFSEIACKKVYYVWVCPTHKNFEWFVETLRKVEEEDLQRILEIHIFITQFFHKFDLRTTMLCSEGRSMFTNLKAVNHFGRPNFESFLQHIRQKHQDVRRIGVFSCGPRMLNTSVKEACEAVNSLRKKPNFIHRYETFITGDKNNYAADFFVIKSRADWLESINSLYKIGINLSSNFQNDDQRTIFEMEPVLVSAFSDNHYHEAISLLNSIRKWFGNRRIVVLYDLGLSRYRIDYLKSSYSDVIVEIKKLKFELLPHGVRNLHECRWKSIVIGLELTNYSSVLWLDSSIVIKKSLKPIFDLFKACK